MPRSKYKKQTKKLDSRLLILSIVLTATGVIAVADASAPSSLRTFGDNYYLAKQQLVSAIIGTVLLMIFVNIKYNFWQKVTVPFFFLSILLLLLVFIPGFGTSLLGAKRWLQLGPASFQPSEIVKLALVLYLAKVADSDKKFVAYVAPLGVILFLLMLQPDLGTALVIAAIGVSQIFISGINFLSLFGISMVGLLGVFLLIVSSDYRRERLMTFLQQTTDPLGSGYHIRQILIALGAGGVFGVGLGQSRQKYLFLPETASDSIFAIIAEEAGFFGATLVIIIFILYIKRGLRIAMNAPDKYSRVLAVGIITWIGGQAFLNLASMVALVPLTGIPLPFLSYGGSSLVTVLMATGILINVSKYESNKKK